MVSKEMEMDFENVKVKVEPGEDSLGQEGDDSSEPYALELQTEDGEKIVIKQEREDEDYSAASVVTGKGAKKQDGANKDKVTPNKTEKKSGTKTLLRRALVEMTDDSLPLKPGNFLKFIEKASSPIPEVAIKKEKSEPENKVSSKDNCLRVTEIKVEKDALNTSQSKSNSETTKKDDSNASSMVVSQNAANILLKAAADIGSKDKAEQSKKIKIVFDVSGKLKEWRVEPKSSDSPMPAADLSKILMFANMMKNKGEKSTVSAEPSLDHLQDFKKSTSSEPPAKKIKVEEESFGGEVDVNFEGFKCKICGKEFLQKSAHTAHMKIHHLSLSGLPGSSPKYSTPQACTLASVKKLASVKPAAAAASTVATAAKTSSSVGTDISDLSNPPRPVTLVSSRNISRLSTAVQQKRGRPLSDPTQSYRIKDSDSYKFADGKSVASPKLVTVSNTTYKCVLCSRTYNRNYAYQMHMKSHHREKPFMCGICDNSYFMHSDLECHLLSHSSTSQKTAVHFTCSVCDQEFESETDLQEHLQSHGNVETETVYECGMCGKELNSQTELKVHMNRHMGDLFEPCKCGICLISFSEVEELKKHIAEKHFTNAEFVCKLCKCRFLTREALKSHMPVHEKLNDVKLKVVHRWKCRYCGMRFELKPNLLAHMGRDHPRNKYFDCSFCDTSFGTKEDLQAHIKTHSVVAHFL